jgi:DNA-binding response OmpR family regulator
MNEKVNILSSATGNKILIYGADAALLKTRQMVLEKVGFSVDIANSQNDFRLRLQRRDVPYSLIVLCHTIPYEEQHSVQHAAGMSGAPVYQLTPLVPPTDFVRQAQFLTQIN